MASLRRLVTGQHRDATLPQVSWVRMRDDRKACGHFHKTEDENLWRWEEVGLESGERHWTGLMSVYVDDILLSGEEDTLKAGLTSLQAGIGQRSSALLITLDEDGNGLRLSQWKYEQEIIARWKVKDAVPFPRFKVSEEDYYMNLKAMLTATRFERHRP